MTAAPVLDIGEVPAKKPTPTEPPSIRLANALANGYELPPVIAECRQIVLAARGGAFPVRPRRWESRQRDLTGKPARSGIADQDVNVRVSLLATDLYALWDRRRQGEEMVEDWAERVKAINRELRQWAAELAPVLFAQEALEAVLATYRAAAPVRIVD